MKISIEIPMAIENLLVPAQKMPVGMVLECNFFHPISNGDKIIGQFPSEVEVLGFFSTGDDFLTNFSSGAGGVHRVCDTGVCYVFLNKHPTSTEFRQRIC